MRIRLLLVAAASVGVAAVTWSCNENRPASATGTKETRLLVPANLDQSHGTSTATSPQSPTAAAPNDPFAPTTPQAAPATGAAAAAGAGSTVAGYDLSEMPAAPKDAQWTLFCTKIGGPGHVERAKDAKGQLIKSTGMKDWYVIHGADESSIYYGFFRTIDDPKDRKERDRAQNARTRIDSLKDGSGQRPFRGCVFVELAAPDPQGEPQWNLANAPTWAAYTWQIAAYKNGPDRKQKAVEAVREARAAGVEAFYYHGPASSSVCIGLWPAQAVDDNTQSAETGFKQSDPSQEVQKGITSRDPDQEIVVVDPVLRDKLGAMAPDKLDKYGNARLTKTPTATVRDPTLEAVMRQYPEHSVNGELRVRKGRVQADPAFLVKVPAREASLLAGGRTQPAGPAFDEPAPTRPRQPSFLNPGDAPRREVARPTGGRLRSLDGR